MSLFRWLTSAAVRDASAMDAGARRLLNEQRDLLDLERIREFQETIDQLRAALRERLADAELRRRMELLQQAANVHLRGYPHAGWREQLLEIQGVCVKVFAVFCFFLQPMAIPSGSAQPTLYGITHVDGRLDPSLVVPGAAKRFIEACFDGARYYQLRTAEAAMLEEIEERRTVFPFVKRQRLRLNDRWHSVWFAPENLVERAKLAVGNHYDAGEDVVKLKVVAGDHLLVDRLTLNFRGPRRGETIVFASTGVPGLIQNTHYIKRLIGLGGERIGVGDDRRVVVNGVRLDASTPRFENLYTFDGPPRDSHYSGHMNNKTAQRFGRPGIAPLFPDGNAEYAVPAKHYLTFGDNTMNSHDSRAWGAFPQEKVIGKAAFVFWPLSSRFGIGFR